MDIVSPFVLCLTSLMILFRITVSMMLWGIYTGSIVLHCNPSNKLSFELPLHAFLSLYLFVFWPDGTVKSIMNKPLAALVCSLTLNVLITITGLLYTKKKKKKLVQIGS